MDDYELGRHAAGAMMTARLFQMMIQSGLLPREAAVAMVQKAQQQLNPADQLAHVLYTSLADSL